MGAYEFATYAKGTVEEAFDTAVFDAQYDYGHSGYTGTIAEKSDYTIISADALSLQAASDMAVTLMNDPLVEDKWGPAGAIRVVDDTHDGWLFFGWASS